MRRLSDLRFLLHGGPVGWLAAAALLAAAILAILVLLAVARREGRRRPGPLAAACAASLAAGLAASWWMAADARRRMIAIALGLADPTHAPIPKADIDWIGATETTSLALLAAGTGLVACASLLGPSALLAAALPRGPLRGAPGRAALAVTLSALALALGLGLLRRADATDALTTTTLASPAQLEQLAATSDGPYAGARAHVLVVATLGLAATALTSIRRSPDRAHPSVPRAPIASVAALVLGVAAFAATRGTAHDARHPIPPDAAEHLGCPSGPEGPDVLPHAPRSEALMDGPLVRLHPGEAVLDGVFLESPDALARALREKNELWSRITGRPSSVRPPLLVVAPAHLAIAEASPWLRAIAQSFGPRLAMVVREPARRFSTRTLGELSSSPHCGALHVTLGLEGPPLSTFRTWGDLARQAAASGATAANALRVHVR
jgi:hypothetical protein